MSFTPTSRQRTLASRRLGVSTVMIPAERLLHGDDRDEPSFTAVTMLKFTSDFVPRETF